MATSGKVQGGQEQDKELSKDYDPATLNASDLGGGTGRTREREELRTDEPGSGGTVGSGSPSSSGLSSIPGGKSRGTGIEAVQEAAEGWAEQLKGGASQLASRAQNVAEKAQDLASNATDNVGTLIRRYPMQSLLIGFGVGALVGFLLPSRR